MDGLCFELVVLTVLYVVIYVCVYVKNLQFSLQILCFPFRSGGESHENINLETKGHFHLPNLCLVLRI